MLVSAITVYLITILRVEVSGGGELGDTHTRLRTSRIAAVREVTMEKQGP